MAKDVIRRIQDFNRDRDPQVVATKYAAMRVDPFSFLRGTCHLFYEDWPADSALDEAPTVWICGDLHLANFGSYKGDNRLTYFDINDFDEAVLAPCTWDLARLLTSILVSVGETTLSRGDASDLCRAALHSYANTLESGHIRSVERATSSGMVGELLQSLKERKRRQFLDQRTRRIGSKRVLQIDNKHRLPATHSEKAHITRLIEARATQHPEGESDFYKVLDVAQRVAGTGSLGVKRYIVLVEGNGSPSGNFLLDLKEARPSALQPYVKVKQPHWQTHAERVVQLQKRIQATPPALLSALELDGNSYVLNEMQATADRIDLANWQGKLRRFERLVENLGEIVAWDELRSGGRQGSAIADDLIAFAKAPKWQAALLKYAQHYAEQVNEDFNKFAAAYDSGKLKVKR